MNYLDGYISTGTAGGGIGMNSGYISQSGTSDNSRMSNVNNYKFNGPQGGGMNQINIRNLGPI
jgi:hypothetical protein